MSTHDAIRAQLQERLDRLTRRAGRIETDLRRTLERDAEEQATDLENDEVLEGLDDATLSEVRQIREALTRIDTGGYGVCANCGQPIAAERLRAVPSATVCVRCAGG